MFTDHGELPSILLGPFAFSGTVVAIKSTEKLILKSRAVVLFDKFQGIYKYSLRFRCFTLLKYLIGRTIGIGFHLKTLVKVIICYSH